MLATGAVEDDLPRWAQQALDDWAEKIDRAAKIDKRKAFETAARDLLAEAQHEPDLGAVQAIEDAVFFLGQSNAGLDSASVNWIIDGAGATAGRNGHTIIDEPPPVESADEFGLPLERRPN